MRSSILRWGTPTKHPPVKLAHYENNVGYQTNPRKEYTGKPLQVFSGGLLRRWDTRLVPRTEKCPASFKFDHRFRLSFIKTSCSRRMNDLPLLAFGAFR
jgi:hypothetical protein